MKTTFDIQAYFPEGWPMKEKNMTVMETTVSQPVHSNFGLKILPAQYLLAKTR